MSRLEDDSNSNPVSTLVSSGTTADPTRLAGHGQCKDSHMDAGKFSDPQSQPTCPCEDGWLSPRMRFILSVVAEVSADIVRDTGVTAIEGGHIEGVYTTNYIPKKELPRGKKSIAPWVKGHSAIFRVILMIFNKRRIPTADTLIETLNKLPTAIQTIIAPYLKHTAIDYALYALVQQAKEEWEDHEFEEVHCDKRWDALPQCAKHDFDWTLAEEMLLG